MSKYGYYRDPEAGDDKVDATGVNGSRVAGLRGHVRLLIQSLDTDSEKVRAQIKRFCAEDKTFKAHWLEILELAKDFLVTDMAAAYALWKQTDPLDRPPAAPFLDLAALDNPTYTPVFRDHDEMDSAATAMFRAAKKK